MDLNRQGMDDRLAEDPTAPPTLDQLDYRDDLRRGGWLGIKDDTLIVVHDGDSVAVPLDDITEMTARDIDRFLGILSLALLGFGLWAPIESLLASTAFAIVGTVSLYLTYRKRDRITVSVAGRAKPIQLYPANASATYAAVTDALHED